MRPPISGPGKFPSLPQHPARLPRLQQGAEQSLMDRIPPWERRVLPARSPAPRVVTQETLTLTSCLPHSNESPLQEALDLGPRRLQGPRPPWPPG